jgi:hypothetical protein
MELKIWYSIKKDLVMKKYPVVIVGYEETAHHENSMLENLREIQGKDPDFNVVMEKETVPIAEAINDLERGTHRLQAITEPFSASAEY